MKITIDTVNKTIEVHESGTLAEIIEFLEQSKINLKEYKFVNKRQETVFIPYHTFPVQTPVYPHWQPTDEFYFDHLYRPGLVTY